MKTRRTLPTRRENKILSDTYRKIQRRYGKAYRGLLSQVPNLIKKYYEKVDGYFDVQDIINTTLQPINEYSQLIDYNDFYDKAYRDAIRQAKFDYKLKYNFSQIDQRSLETFRAPQNWFVSKYQTLTDQEMTLNQMEELWKSGESVDSAVKQLEKIFTNSNKRILAHAKSTILTNNTRIRSTADLNNFSQNGVLTYVYRAVIDNVTTPMCKDLDGKRYSIKKALDFQRKTDEETNKIIQDGQRRGLADWQIYNNTVQYLQNNDALANRTGTEKRPWQTQVILRTRDPQKQGKKIIRSYKDLDSVPGNKIPRPPTHHNCRSRIEPDL